MDKNMKNNKEKTTNDDNKNSNSNSSGNSNSNNNWKEHIFIIYKWQSLHPKNVHFSYMNHELHCDSDYCKRKSEEYIKYLIIIWRRKQKQRNKEINKEIKRGKGE